MSDLALLQAAADKRAPRAERKALQRIDWLQLALEIFVNEGIDAVRITRLADDLKVTRGSFYWHFKNREDLIDALVSYWKSKNTPAIRAAVGEAESLADGIFRFFEICVDPDAFDPRLDLALREWSRRSEAIRTLIDEEDAARVEALRAFFIRFDYDETEAMVRARVMYYSQIGFYAIEVRESLQQRLEYTDGYFLCFTGKTLDQQESADFQKHILDAYGARIP